MRQLMICAAGLGLAMLAGGCGSSGSGPVIEEPPVASPPPPPTDFTTFVKDQFAATSDSTDPVDVDDEDFEFSDDEDPAAYDDLL